MKISLDAFCRKIIKYFDNKYPNDIFIDISFDDSPVLVSPWRIKIVSVKIKPYITIISILTHLHITSTIVCNIQNLLFCHIKYNHIKLSAVVIP